MNNNNNSKNVVCVKKLCLLIQESVWCVHVENRVRPGEGSLLLIKKAFDGINGVDGLYALNGELEGVLLDSLVKVGAVELVLLVDLVGADPVWHNVLGHVVAHVVDEE